MKHFKGSDYLDYLDDPERAVGVLNRVIASGGDLATIERALVVVALALSKAGYGEPVVEESPPRAARALVL